MVDSNGFYLVYEQPIVSCALRLKICENSQGILGQALLFVMNSHANSEQATIRHAIVRLNYDD